MSETNVAPHSCKHPYQDRKHGKGMRVWNKCEKQGGGGWRCTVCGFVKGKA